MTSEIHINGTTTDPAVRVSAALGEEADQLFRAYQGKAGLVAELRLDGERRQQAVTGLAEFVTDRLRPHLAATDQVLYAGADQVTETRLLVRALRGLHASLAQRIDALLSANTPDGTARAAHAVEVELAACLGIERTVLLPALAELPGVDLPRLAADLRTVLDGGDLDAPAVIDVRPIPRPQRHPTIFHRFALLGPGESFVLVNNHDPKPLRREFTSAHPDQFTWDYVESGPELWRVRIGRSATTGT